MAGARVHRVSVHALAPGRSFTFVHRCRKGERLVNAGSSVAFLRRTRPSERELSEVQIAHTERFGRGGKETVHIRTGRHVGDDEKVQAQVHMFCA